MSDDQRQRVPRGCEHENFILVSPEEMERFRRQLELAEQKRARRRARNLRNIGSTWEERAPWE